MLGAAVTAPANPESPANVALAALALTAGAGWLGYRWLTRHPAAVPLPGALLAVIIAAAAIAAAAAFRLWRGLHPHGADEARPESWGLIFRPGAALTATAATLFALIAAAAGWAAHAPLLPAVGLGAAAALAGGGFCWERFRLAQRRTALRHTLIQALYGPLGHRLPGPAVVPAIHWEKNTDKPEKATVRAQRGGARLLAPTDGEDPVDVDAPVMRGDSIGIVRQALRTHTGVLMRVSADPSGLIYTATRQEAGQANDSYAELIRKVKSVFGTGTTVPADSMVITGDTVTRFVVQHNIGHKLTGEFRKRTTEQNLTELLGGGWRATWDMTASTVTFELKPTLPEMVYPTPVPEVASLEQAVSQYRQTRFDFGVDLDMNPQQWNPLDSPHSLVAGKTGAGKTVFLRTLCTQAARRGWAIVLVDFKGGSYSDLVDWPNVHIVSSDPYDSIATIHRMYALMNDRNARGRWDQRVWDNNIPYLIVIDEFTQLTEVIKRVWANAKPKGGPKDPPTITELGELARLCRTARMHLVVGMQRPDADFLSTEVRDNFGNKVSVGPISRIAADMLFENAYTGRYVPRIKGRGMATGTHQEPRETQFFYTPPADTTIPDEAKVIASLRPSHRLIPRYVPELPADPASASWSAITEARWFPLSERPDLDPANVCRQITRWRGDSRLGFDPGPDSGTLAFSAGQDDDDWEVEDEVDEVDEDDDYQSVGGVPVVDDREEPDSRDWEPMTVPAGEILGGDIVTFDGVAGYVEGVDVGIDGTVTVMWEDDNAQLSVTRLPPSTAQMVLRRNSSNSS